MRSEVDKLEEFFVSMVVPKDFWIGQMLTLIVHTNL